MKAPIAVLLAAVGLLLPGIAPAEAHKWDSLPAVERTIWKVGQKEDAPTRHRIAAYMACYTETDPDCDRDGVGDGGLAIGPWQMHPHWGTRAQRMNIRYGARWFYRMARARDRGQPLGVLCADIEQPAAAYRGRYGPYEGRARATAARQHRKDVRIRKRRR